MRAFMVKRIEALHDEIARLIEVEKAWARRASPAGNEFLQHISDTKSEWLRYPPDMRGRYAAIQSDAARAAGGEEQK